MKQTTFLKEKLALKAPNISTVPQYSPLRYPGGKTWLYPFAKRWLETRNYKVLIEPFAGGASVGLAAAIEGLVDKVILVEKDENIFSIWHTIIYDDAEWLASKILNFELNESNIDKALENQNKSIRDRAFATLLSNRISHGGILASGGGRLKNGENGKGLRSRWYPKTLQSRIRAIAQSKNRLTVIHGDAFDIISEHINDEILFFIDPPYTKAGKRLYNHFSIDHDQLFSLLCQSKSDFLMTYDKADEIDKLAKKYYLDTENILMQTTHLIKKYELLIGHDLSWLK